MGLKILSHNVQGFNSPTKRRKAFQYYSSLQIDILLLQETHFSVTSYPKFLHKAYPTIFMANSSNKTKGVAICIKAGLQLQVLEVYRDSNGRYLTLKILMEDQTLTLVSYYAPNTNQVLFFETLISHLSHWAEGQLIIGGDTNSVLDRYWDRQTISLQSTNSPSHISPEGVKIKNLCTSEGWVDIWRELHPAIRQYSHYSAAHKVYTRIDHIWVSQGLIEASQTSRILNTPWSDHSPILYTIASLHLSNSRGRWRMNESILKIPELYAQIETSLKTYFQENINSVTSYATLWEAHKAVIRGLLIQCGAQRKKARNLEIRQATTQLNDLVYQQIDNPMVDLRGSIDLIRTKLDLLLTHKTEKAWKWTQQKLYYYTNKPSRLLARKLNKRLDYTPINKIKTKNGFTTTTLHTITQEFYNFYKELYKAPPPPAKTKYEAFFRDINLPTLTLPQHQILDAIITEEEVGIAIKFLKLPKTPGPDGFPALYYKKFSHILIPHLTKMFNHLLTGDKFQAQTLMASIIPIPKPDTDLTECKNYRPISILNLDVKILAKVLANRLSVILPKLIQRDQVGFVRGRQATDAIRRLILLTAWANKTKTPSLLLKLDVKKAFDSLAWPYLKYTLQKWGVGANFMRWIQTLYDDPTAKIHIGSYTSPPFTIKRGTRQGCPLSPLLFDLALEPLAIAIRNNQDICGCNQDDQHHKLNMFADDITLFITRPLLSLPNLYLTLQNFGVISGLTINHTKTEALSINLPHELTKLLSLNFEFQWNKNHITVLGIQLTKTFEQLYQANYPKVYSKISKLLEDWGKYHISWIGRITAIKMVLLPKLLYLFRVLPIPLKRIDLKKLEANLSAFIWAKKPPRIRVNILQRSKRDGGLGLPNLWKYYIAAQLTHIPFLHINNISPLWVYLENSMAAPYTAESLLWTQRKHRPIINSPTLRHTLVIWDTYAALYNLQSPHTPVLPIFKHPQFIPGQQIRAFQWWRDQNLGRVGNLLTVRGPFTIDYLKENYKLPNSEYFRASQILHFVSQCWKQNTNRSTKQTFFEKWCLDGISPLKAITIIYQYINSPKDILNLQYIKSWSKELNKTLGESDWKKIWDNTRNSSNNTILLEAGYKVLFRWYLTPKKLAHIYPNTNENCFRGCCTPGTMGHIWWTCPKAIRYWIRVYNMIFAVLNVNVQKNPYEALLGAPVQGVTRTQQKLINQIFLAAKQVLARSWKSPAINYNLLKPKIDWIFVNEKLTSIALDKYPLFLKTWQPWIDYRFGRLLSTSILST
uniref:Reverse transcriptase domain-containing protein n=1 Tax=Xenopus tropicalis TaxID=8364 RepID=A0A803JA29_XENTR